MTMIRSWPEAILHCDADAFYVGCELTRHPELRGKPVVVTGKLGSCILAKSYDLKAKGVKTAMPSWEVAKKFPEITILPADFDFYHQLSEQMFAVLRKWTPEVEVYSIDEAFLDMKGFRRLYKMDYAEMARQMKEEIKEKVGITVSVGVSVTKTLAKMAAEINKPDGVTVISWRRISSYLQKIPVEDVPGFGKNIVPFLQKQGVNTCAEFTALSEDIVRSWLHRPGVDLWKELRGQAVHRVQTSWAANKMITRTSSFSPLSDDQSFLWAHTMRQLERAIEALRDDQQLGQEVSLYLRDKEFIRYSWGCRLDRPSNGFLDFQQALKKIWSRHFPRGKTFRSTGVVLTKLTADKGMQWSLFEDPVRLLKQEQLETAKQDIKNRYGNHAIRAASSLRLKSLGPVRKKALKARAFNVDW